jgi:hypothetical protein
MFMLMLVHLKAKVNELEERMRSSQHVRRLVLNQN